MLVERQEITSTVRIISEREVLRLQVLPRVPHLVRRRVRLAEEAKVSGLQVVLLEQEVHLRLHLDQRLKGQPVRLRDLRLQVELRQEVRPLQLEAQRLERAEAIALTAIALPRIDLLEATDQVVRPDLHRALLQPAAQAGQAAQEVPERVQAGQVEPVARAEAVDTLRVDQVAEAVDILLVALVRADLVAHAAQALVRDQVELAAQALEAQVVEEGSKSEKMI